VAEEGELLNAEGPPDGLQVLDHEISCEAERVRHLGASTSALVKVEHRVVASERSQVGAEPLQVESRAAVEHYDGIRPVPIYLIEQTHTIHPCHVP
jgi:hypothetical protein